jgi:hypothetical protein
MHWRCLVAPKLPVVTESYRTLHSAQLCALGTRKPGCSHAAWGRQLFEGTHNAELYITAVVSERPL